ncbi:serine/threonine-protein phosphatase 6 regulatory ankyrin repeat subunit B [Patella vulgata]|uniref:serine/threonine-protein phosphatase 6 regulatory ankyrin repeat subunit B n=1 Tax=Patella vulgata TaxID=6465 RepID=UPI0021805D32|nr:serine/threonine-protein phosphatase 6 regulatory ankyrin repeat subunit B [Patella vulgata]
MAGFRWKKSAEVLEKEIDQDKRLIDAVNEGDTGLVESLLKAGVSADALEYNRSLFYASKNYLTPIQFAVTKDSSEIVEILVEYEANVNAKDRFDVTAVHIAAENGSLKCLQVLLEAGADTNIATKYSKYGSYTATPHAGGTTALQLAAMNNHVSCVKELIYYGADYNAVDEFGRTSLYIAAQKGFADCVHAHLDNAIRTDILSIPVKETNETPLHECVRHGNLSCVSSLLKHGSDCNYKNSAGLSALHLSLIADKKFSMEIVRELITQGYNIDVNLKDRNGNTPLHYVCFTDHCTQDRRPHAAAFLIAYGADFNITNKAGDVLLQQELRNPNGDKTIIKAILHCAIKLPLDSLIPNLIKSGSKQYQDLQASYQYYRSFSKYPHTLQHYCRFVIRKSLGIKRLRQVPCLPLPTTLKEYLLLDVQSFS